MLSKIVPWISLILAVAALAIGYYTIYRIEYQMELWQEQMAINDMNTALTTYHSHAIIRNHEYITGLGEALEALVPYNLRKSNNKKGESE